MPDLQDRAPFLSPVPASPWGTRARDFNRRPALFKQLIFLGVFVAIAVPVWLFTFRGDDSVQLSDSDPQHWNVGPRPSPPPTHNDGFSHRPATPFDAAPSQGSKSSHSQDVQFGGSPAQDTVKSEGPMIFALIMWGADSAAEGAILLKSILMYTSGPVHFHIICDDVAQAYLDRRFELVKRPRYEVYVRLYRPTWQALLDRIEREGSIRSVHAAGTPGLMKLFIHEILPPSISKVVFVDTDAFFISDPYLLWTHFQHTLPPSTIISMPTHPEMFAPEWFDANKICSCVMLMDLDGLRKLRLMDSSYYRAAKPSPLAAYSPSAFRALFGPPNEQSGKYENIALGDQSYWWAIIQYMNQEQPTSSSPNSGDIASQQMFQHLHYDWETSSCLLDMYFTSLEQGKDDANEEDELSVQLHTWQTPHQSEVIMPKLLHFNCLPGPRYYEWQGWESPEDDRAAGTDGLARRWGTAVKYHVGYKWLWLNQCSERIAKPNLPSCAKVTVEKVYDVKFADELISSYDTSEVL